MRLPGLMILFVVLMSQQVQAQESSQEIAKVGDYVQFLAPASGLFFTALHKDGKGAQQLLESTVVSVAVTHSLKHMINSERPNGGSYSFPSGHTAFAFTGSTFIHERYGWKWGISAHAVAMFVG